jgi:predicted phosphodiesterase
MSDASAMVWHLDHHQGQHCGLPILARSDHARVARALDESLDRTRAAGNVLRIDIETNPMIIFSDQHKGARNGADDFQVAEETYNQAITYYHRMGYTLLTLGDVEELWEERPQPVIEAYPKTFELEALYHVQGRYLRVWGNHDDNWRYPEQVKKYLDPVYGSDPLNVREGLLLNVNYGSHSLGKIYLVHGHQGTLDSDRFAAISRILVRYLWRPFQRLTKIPSNTPATNWRLRQSHNIALYTWSAQQKKLILIAGHTHRPVFESLVDQSQLRKEISALQTQLETEPVDNEQQEKLNELQEELAWVKQTQQGQFALEQSEQPIKPSYYNTGCCCYPDRSITGIELVAGEIRLVRWENTTGQGQRSVLARASLSDIFAAI